jgi:hypothetical protein
LLNFLSFSIILNNVTNQISNPFHISAEKVVFICNEANLKNIVNLECYFLRMSRKGFCEFLTHLEKNEISINLINREKYERAFKCEL